MSKKIKALVQKYEKDMQFENRFDDLRHKLDLIPDAEVKSEVFTIKRKVMPAYVMMIVLLMLVTGIIGLQFGLNGDFVEGPTTVDDIERNLMEMADIYEREAVAFIVLDQYAKVYLYIGQDEGQDVLIVYLRAFNPELTIQVDIEGSSILMSNDIKYQVVKIDSTILNIGFIVSSDNYNLYESDYNFDFQPYFDLLGQ
ncbi:hypothetical protein [Paracholeplasma manati]|uniref:hypothetical protein n=1 Tax=Paracholeplasma manati TaxID=591373 RepID=UPI00240830EF|nr:hypothetical protein [Paracholeplasma manati]MDG0889478.1 hypothetical protein [Paracholeplasma manati]